MSTTKKPPAGLEFVRAEVRATAPALSKPTAPAAPPPQQSTAVEVTTLFTQAGVKTGEQTPTIYAGDRDLVEITLELETAGPVVVGTRADLAPILSGKGVRLTTDKPYVICIPKGTRLYYLATAVNRVKVQISPKY